MDAIQPEVVGPLFAKRGDRVKVYLDFWIWLGTPGRVSAQGFV
jgi:hypothetical protein